jgi:hypothetical protein
MIYKSSDITKNKIFIFWAPMAATWLMMAAEGPILAGVIARLAEPKYNLAAFGVAFAFAVLIEAPIIMIMSASTALAKDRDSFLKMRNFSYTLNAFTTLLMVIFIIPPVFDVIILGIVGLPKNVAELTYRACILFLPWPAAIGYRRFYQGILIRSNKTRRLAYGTILRLCSTATTALICFHFFSLDGALVGAIALSIGVTVEAGASKIMVRSSVKALLKKKPVNPDEKPLSYGYITKFYYPLALTSIIGLGVHPMVTFFLGQSRMAIESLAVLPVVNAFVFLFRSLGLSFQEVGIALLGENNENFKILKSFTIQLIIIITAVLFVVAFSPLSYLWYNKVSGLSIQLTDFSILPTKILILLPGLTVLLSFMRSIMVNNKKTTAVTIATAIDVAGIFSILFITTKLLGMIGVIGAAIAIATGRLLANAYISIPCYKILKSKK